MKPSSEGAREALAARARVDPEQPFLFFRSPRGTFTWWSFARAARALDATLAPETDPVAACEVLDLLRSADVGELAQARELAAAIARPGEREIWISARALDRAEERRLALAGALAGWAVVREPPGLSRAEFPPELFLWVRPTIVSGTEDEIVTLFGGVAGAAPHWRRARWLARRLERLRTVLVENGGSTDHVRRALESTGAAFTPAPRVLPFPGSGW